jgi:hypothetical protein
MGWAIALVIIIGVVALDVAMLNNNKQDEAPNTPYARSAHLFNPAERSFLQVLDRVVGDNDRQPLEGGLSQGFRSPLRLSLV